MWWFHFRLLQLIIIIYSFLTAKPRVIANLSSTLIPKVKAKARYQCLIKAWLYTNLNAIVTIAISFFQKDS